MEGLYCYHYITLIEFCQLKGGIMAQEILKPLLLDETGKEIVLVYINRFADMYEIVCSRLESLFVHSNSS